MAAILPKRPGPASDSGASKAVGDRYPVTPDGRYFVVRGRLWRRSDPALTDDRRTALVDALMNARRAVGAAIRLKDHEVLRRARADVGAAKAALGERGPPWWTDGAPDLNRKMATHTTYADWFNALPRETVRETGPRASGQPRP